MAKDCRFASMPFIESSCGLWLHRGEPVRWTQPWGLLDDGTRLEEAGTVLITKVRIDRVFLIAGLFYGIQGMNIGGTRVLQIAPHLAYRDEGVPGVIPPNAVLTAELSVLSERTAGRPH
jgi:hypothetical protein